MPFKIDPQSRLEFEYVKHLGTGKNSEVHLAKCVDNEDWVVAIKRCRTDMDDHDSWLKQVEREISALHHLNTAETPNWSLELPLEERFRITENTVEDRFVIQLFSVFDIDGLPAIAIEVAPPSVTSYKLDKPKSVEVMTQLAQAMQVIHAQGTSITDFDPLTKLDRVRWDDKRKQMKIIDWNVTTETKKSQRRDIIYAGRIFYQMVIGQPVWAKIKPSTNDLPDAINEYALDNTGIGIAEWHELEFAIRDVIERLMIQDAPEQIIDADSFVEEMVWLKQIVDLSEEAKAGRRKALEDLETLLKDAIDHRPPEIRKIVDIGNFWMQIAPDNKKAEYQKQIDSAQEVLRSLDLDPLSVAMEYLEAQQYGDAEAEFNNVKNRSTTHVHLYRIINYRLQIAEIAGAIQTQNLLDSAQLKSLVKKLLEVTDSLESPLWEIDPAERIQAEIQEQFPAKVVAMPQIVGLFNDINASKIFNEQVQILLTISRQPMIYRDWHLQEENRIRQIEGEIIPQLQKAENLALIKSRVAPTREQLNRQLDEDKLDLDMVRQYFAQLQEGTIAIDIETYLQDSTLNRPYAPLSIDPSLLPRDKYEVGDNTSSVTALADFEEFQRIWNSILFSDDPVQGKIERFQKLIDRSEEMIKVFSEKLTTITVPGADSTRKTVQKALAEKTDFIDAVDKVYTELKLISNHRIPNISSLQKKWMYVTNFGDSELKRLVTEVQFDVASHTHDQVREKSLEPELAMLVYEILDVPVPTEVMQIGQEIQLAKYMRDTLRDASKALQDPDATREIIGKLNSLTANSLGELDEVLRDVINKLEQFREAMLETDTVRQVRSVYRIGKRRAETNNKDIVAFMDKLDEATETLINKRVQDYETVLDKAKTHAELTREEQTLINSTQKMVDTLRYNNLISERRWHHVQNSLAYLLREHSQAMEGTISSFESFDFAQASKHIEQATRLAQIFEFPYNRKLGRELQLADETLQRLSNHPGITNPIENVKAVDIERLLNEEIQFWEELKTMVGEFTQTSQVSSDTVYTFDTAHLTNLIEQLQFAQEIVADINDIRHTVGQLREFETRINMNQYDFLRPLHQRLTEMMSYNYTTVLAQQLQEIESVATGKRKISNESVLNRLTQGYTLIDLNNQLQILDDATANRRQKQLQSNTYTALKNIRLKNRDERNALAKFITTIPPREIQERDFQAVLQKLAEDRTTYSYLQDAVRTVELPQFGRGNNRTPLTIMLGVLILLAVVALVLVLNNIFGFVAF